MRILVYSINYAPEITATGYYTGDLAERLAARGHDVTVLAASPFYPEWKTHDGYKNWSFRKETLNGVEVIRCPTFIPSNPSGMTRIAHYGSFAVSSFFLSVLFASRHRADIVLNIAPTILSSIAALMAAYFHNAKSWLHIQDFEVEAGFATGQMSSDGILAKLALATERFIIRRFGTVSSISYEMLKKLQAKGRHVNNLYELRNWSNIVSIFPQQSSVYRQKWKIDRKYVALYSGSIARKQGIDILVEAAKLLQHRDDIQLIVCGNGPNRDNLARLGLGLDNIKFFDLQPYECLNDLLALATVHLIPQKAGAADLVLPSKLSNMLASGRPVIVGAEPRTGLAREIEGCGVAVEPESASAIAKAIEAICASEEDQRTMGVNARERAIKFWDAESIIADFEKKLTE